jgi:hypothetical protein
LARGRCQVSLRNQVAEAVRLRSQGSGHDSPPAEVIEAPALMSSRAHTTRTTGSILWCTKCGRHSNIGRKVRGLGTGCNGVPSIGDYGYYQLISLERGLHPVSGVALC